MAIERVPIELDLMPLVSHVTADCELRPPSRSGIDAGKQGQSELQAASRIPSRSCRNGDGDMSANSPRSELPMTELVVEFYPVDQTAVDSVKAAFAGHDIIEADAFTGVKTIAVVVNVAKQSMAAVLEFFALGRQGYKDAVVKIGREEISLKGYTSDEVRSLMDSPMMHKLLRELKKND